jgi:phosphoribosylglycinamide formyltransferase-1
VRIAALASGTGTILEALIAEDLPIALVVVDRACAAIEIARAAGIEVAEHIRTDYRATFDREAYSEELLALLRAHSIDLIVMAGFGTIVGRAVHAGYEGRILNTHPALLPSFKGWHAVEDALSAGVKITGCTVHVATLEVDEGLILAQEPVVVLPGDTKDELHERIKAVERRLYPATVRRVISQLENGEPLS